MPAGDADAGGSHGYVHSSVEGWGKFYQDLMNGRVLDKNRRTGITKAAWETGAIFRKRQLVAADYFATDTTSCYKTTGKVTWTGRGGKHENIALGDAQTKVSRMLLPVALKNRATITARVQVPATGAEADAVGVVLSDGKAELDAMLTYGTKAGEKGTICIQAGKTPGKSFPMLLVPGWYTAKLLFDSAAKPLSLKVWSDGEQEPASWHVTHDMTSDWKPPANAWIMEIIMGFLRQLFGPSQEEIWRQLCSEIGAQYVEGGFWKGDKVQAHHGQWTFTLDTYTTTDTENNTSTTYTQMRAPYVNKDGFRFTIYRKSIFSGLGKLLGMQDVEVGYPDLDEAFIIKGNDEAKLRALFANPKIRQLIEMQPSIYLTVKDDEGWFGTQFPEGVDELYFSVPWVVKDVEQLKSFYYLFAEMLNHLCHIGSAYENDPNLEL
jgi:hypothetical protein